jgi:8-oxo-dGTP diphosphatase
LLVNRAFVVRKDRKILLIKRTGGEYYNPGKLEIPGGKLDKGQDITHALEREVLEETGLLSDPVSRTAYVDGEIVTSGKYKGLPYIVIIGISKQVGGKIRLSEEHVDYAWVTTKEAFDYDLTAEVRKALVVLEKKISSPSLYLQA